MYLQPLVACPNLLALLVSQAQRTVMPSAASLSVSFAASQVKEGFSSSSSSRSCHVGSGSVSRQRSTSKQARGTTQLEAAAVALFVKLLRSCRWA